MIKCTVQRSMNNGSQETKEITECDAFFAFGFKKVGETEDETHYVSQIAAVNDGLDILPVISCLAEDVVNVIRIISGGDPMVAFRLMNEFRSTVAHEVSEFTIANACGEKGILAGKEYRKN